MPEMNNSTYLTPVELAERWRRTTNAIQKMRKRGQGPPFTTLDSGGVLYDLADIEEYERTRKIKPENEE